MRGQPQEPCPTCRGFARIPINDGKQFACARCGTVLPPLPYGYQRGGGIPHFTPLRIGMKAQIQGKEFFAVGRIRFTEKDDEGSVSNWEEWVLLHPDGQTYYLEYDEGKWTLTEDYEPAETPEGSRVANATESDMLRVDGRLCNVFSVGVCRAEAVEGEIPWQVPIGQPLRYVDMTGGDAIYSAEIPAGGSEVEWFRGRRLTDREVFTMFSLYDLLKALDKREQAQKGRRGFGLICLLAALVALVGWAFSYKQGRVVGQGSVPVGQIASEEGARFGPFRLTEKDRVYRLRISSNLTASAVWVQGALETDTAGEFFNVNGDFWDESGYDSDGAWHEYNLQARQDFRLSAPGEVYVRLYAEPDSSATSAASAATVTFAIEEGVIYPTYLAIFGFTGLALGLCFLIASSPDVGGKVWKGLGSS